MSYRLRVENDARDGLDFWENFMNKSGFLDSDEHNIDYYLEPYGAKNVGGLPYVEFRNEHEALMFVLRWS